MIGSVLRRGRVHPLDVVLMAIGLVGLVHLIVVAPGYHWAATYSGGIVRAAPVVVTLEVVAPVRVALARQLARGRMTIELGARTADVVLLGSNPGPAGSVELHIALTSEFNRAGQPRFGDCVLVPGNRLVLRGRLDEISGTVVTIAERQDAR